MPDKPRRAPRRRIVEAKSVTLTKLGADGEPVGGPIPMPGMTATVHLEPEESAAETTAPAFVSGADLTIDAPISAAVRELARIPLPTAVISTWFPAFVRVPSESQAWSKCKVFLTPQGLYVYKSRPKDGVETVKAGAFPAWYSTVDFEKTHKPAVGNVARNAGIRIQTAAGVVIVQPIAHCGCGSQLKHWRPMWARNVIAWRDAVALVAGTDVEAGR